MALGKRGGNFFNLLQKNGVPRKGEGGGSNPGENYVTILCLENYVKYETRKQKCFLFA